LTARLRAEVDRLGAQNAALRSDAEDQRRRRVNNNGGSDDGPASGGGGGHVLGGGDVVPGAARTATATGGDVGARDNNLERARVAERTSKKLQERFATQGSRLGDFESQVKELKGKVEQLLRVKGELEKKVGVREREAAKLRAGGAEGLDGLEDTRKKVFELEEAQALLQRRAEVELPNQVRKLKAELDEALASRHRLQLQLDKSGSGGGGGRSTHGGGGDGFGGGLPGRSMLDSEDAFLKSERLSDEVSALRQDKARLEMALLGNDASGLELQFDLTLREQEVERLKRRVKELEGANALLGGGDSAGGGGGGDVGNVLGGKSGAGGSSSSSSSGGGGRGCKLLERPCDCQTACLRSRSTKKRTRGPHRWRWKRHLERFLERF